jgi:hypothetical protein
MPNEGISEFTKVFLVVVVYFDFWRALNFVSLKDWRAFRLDRRPPVNDYPEGGDG